MNNNIIVEFPYGKWIEESVNNYIFVDFKGEIIYRTKDLLILGNIGFSIPLNIGEHDYSSDTMVIEHGRVNSNSSIVHFGDAVMVLIGTEFQDVQFSDEGFLVYPVDNRLSYKMAIYDSSSRSLKEGFFSSEYMEILDNRHILSLTNDAYSLITAVLQNVDEYGNKVYSYITEPVGLEPFQIVDGNKLVTKNGVYIRDINI